MSYGFDLAHFNADEDPRAYLERSANANADPADGTVAAPPADPARAAANQGLADALQRRVPSLRQFQRDYAAIAARHRIAEQEARQRYSDIELNDPEHSLQVTLFTDQAGISFSYTGGGDPCRKAVEALLACIETLQTEAGYSTFDPQLNRLLDLAQDRDQLYQRLCASSSAP